MFERLFRFPARRASRRNLAAGRSTCRLSVDLLEKRELLTAFTPGNLVVLQAGNGTAYTNTAPLYLDEFTTTPGSAMVQQAALPTTASGSNVPITMDLTAAAGVGQLARSFDGSVLTLGGLDSGINSTTATGSADRVIAVVGRDPAATGAIDTTTHGQFDTGDDLRGAVEANSSTIYTVGHSGAGGTRYFNGVGHSPTAGTQVSANGNTRGDTIGFDNRLYWTSAGPPAGVYTETPALPTTTQTSDTLVAADPNSTGKTGGVFLADMNGDGLVDEGDRIYFTDDGTVAGAGTGGIYVATYHNGHWQDLLGNVGQSTQLYDPAGDNLRGLTGVVVSSTEVLLYTNQYDGVAGDTSSIYQGDDNFGAGTINVTTLQTLTQTNNEGFRGVALAPVAPTVNTLTVDNAAPPPGTTVTLTATLTSASGTPTGSVVFRDGTTVLGSAPVNGSGVATFQMVFSGTHKLSAYYAGGSFAAATSNTVTVVEVGSTASTTVLSADVNPTTVNRTATLTATVTGSGTPTGNVVFSDGSTVLGNANLNGSGVATITTAFAATGTHSLTASYGGDGTFAVSSGTLSETVNANASAVVTSSANPTTVGATPTYTATVTGTSGSPTGTVQFFIDGTTIGSPATLSGSGNSLTANVTSPALTAGSHFITVTYTPSGATNPYTTFTTTNATALIEYAHQAFHPGNLVVVRRGDGGSALGNPNTLVFLDEYTTGGTLVQSIAMPNTDSGSTHILGMSGTAGTEGALERSVNGYFLTLAGFDVAIGTGSVTGTSAGTVPRVVGRVDANGNIDTSTALHSADGIVPSNVRGAVSNDGNEFWVVSDVASGVADSGINYATLGSITPVAIGPTGGATATTARVVAIFGGQLYVSTNDKSGTPAKVIGLELVGTGLPTTQTTLSTPPGFQAAYNGAFTTNDPYAFLILSHTNTAAQGQVDVNHPADTIYVADQTNGLLKFALVAGSWVFEGQKLDFAGGFTGLTGYEDVSGHFVLYATGNNAATAAVPNQLATFTDTNAFNAAFSSGSPTSVANAATNENFMGVAFAPGYTTTTALVSSANPSNYGTSVTFTATVTAPTGTPSGTVTFMDGSTALGTVALNGSGVATLITSALTVGAHAITVHYNGDVNDGTSTSSALTQAVNYTPGDLVVSRVGTGSGSLSSNATATFIDDYTTAGTQNTGNTVTLPTAGNTATISTATESGTTVTVTTAAPTASPSASAW